MKWAPGRDKHGRVQSCSDGNPAFYVSDCGRFTVSRAAVGNHRYLYDAWRRVIDERGRWQLPIQIDGGLNSSDDAIAACVRYSNDAGI